MTHHNCLILSVDFDGCSDNAHGRHKIIEDARCFVNQHPTIDEIVVIIGSLRQSLFLDKYNAIDYANYHHASLVSCKLLGESFVFELKQALPPHLNIHFDPILTSDIYNQLQAGTTFQAMQNYFASDMSPSHIVTNQNGQLIDLLLYPSKHQEEVGIRGTRELIDFSKISIMYMQMQHVANRMPNASIAFRFYDDRMDIHQKLKNFFQDHPYSIPENMFWNSVLNKSQETELSPQQILTMPLQGTGPIEHRYTEILNQVLETCPFQMIDDHINQQILEQVLVQTVQKMNAEMDTHMIFTP